MSASFASASSKVLTSSTSFVAAAPLTMACWVYPTTTSTTRSFSSFDSSGASRGFCLRQNSGNVWAFRNQTSAVQSTEATAGTVAANNWYFVVGREISATNRRIDILHPDGSIAAAQNTTNRTPSSVNQGTIGADRLGSFGATQNYFDGFVAEWWFTDTDIGRDGTALESWFIRRLALYGPWSVPHIAKDIIEYRSFRSTVASDTDNPHEVYCRSTRPAWTNVNSVLLGRHAPLPGGYVKPQDSLLPPVMV